MDTTVTIDVVSPDDGDEAVLAAFSWFDVVENICSRFEPESETSRLYARPGEWVRVSDLLFEALAFATAVARASEGAFDPTLGARLISLGFDRSYRTGARSVAASDRVSATFEDIELNDSEKSVRLRRPLVIDLGAVAKGLAIDLAARELDGARGFVIDAGGDIFASGNNLDGNPWRIGIRHPRLPEQLLAAVEVSSLAVCTSGDYERVSRTGQHHLIDHRSHIAAQGAASVTVIAPTAMAADALATAAFVLGPARGIKFLEEQGAEGLIADRNLELLSTRHFERYCR